MNLELSVLDPVADSDNPAICGGSQRLQGGVATGNGLKGKK